MTADHVYEVDDDPSEHSDPACPVCGRFTSVEHIGQSGLVQWWCGDCNTAFPDPDLGTVSARWATNVRDLIEETRRKAS